MEKEIWKDIPNYEGMYQVSNFGRVKSLERYVKSRGNGVWLVKEKILKPTSISNGYRGVCLRNGKKPITKRIHQLVAICFLNHTPQGRNIVVDHIDDDKTNNNVNNLQIVTHRYNSRKTQGRYTSKYKGVYWAKKENKWIASIRINKKLYTLGRFINEMDAAKAYHEALDNLGEKYEPI